MFISSDEEDTNQDEVEEEEVIPPSQMQEQQPETQVFENVQADTPFDEGQRFETPESSLQYEIAFDAGNLFIFLYLDSRIAII